MAVVIALLRGINVGGHNLIKMEELSGICDSLKLSEPRTYLQSGNVVFKTGEKDLLKLAKRIEGAIEHGHGFRPSVFCRTVEEMKASALRNPFAKRADLDPSKLAVVFLAAEPSNMARAKLLQIKAEPEELLIGRNELFIYFPNGMGRPKLSMAAVERAIQMPMTSRNWNTVRKLIEMAEEIGIRK